MTNFARSSLALVLRAVFGGAKSCALVKLFMICPPVGSRQSTMAKFLPLDRGYLMAIKPSKLGTQSWNWGPKLRSDSDCSRPTSTGGPRGATPGPDFEKEKEKSAKRLWFLSFPFLISLSPDSVVFRMARVCFSQCSKHRDYCIAQEFGGMRACIAYERLNELQRRRLLRRTCAHNPVPLLIGEHREVLHRLHISPTGQRFRRAWDVDVPPSALSAALEGLTIACQLARVFDCSRRAPCKGHGHN
jgi:hypothetical protein